MYLYYYGAAPRSGCWATGRLADGTKCAFCAYNTVTVRWRDTVSRIAGVVERAGRKSIIVFEPFTSLMLRRRGTLYNITVRIMRIQRV